MRRRTVALTITVLLTGTMHSTVWPALAAEVTPQRLVNPEPHDWLMNHRTHNGQRLSPFARINKGNVKNLKLAYPVPLGGGSGNEFIPATPPPEDRVLYITASLG